MLVLNIQEDDLLKNKEKVLEKCFLSAILNIADMEIVNNTLKKYNELKDIILKKDSI